MNRRQFLKRSAAGAAGVIVAGRLHATPASSRPIGANGDIRIAVIGFKSHGRTHIKAYQSMPGVRLVALCDVDEQVLASEAAALDRAGVRVARYRDLRALLDNKEIDAVSLAIPNHWHALASIWACQAGKDVCVEKPVSHCIWEGRKIVEAARKYGRMVQADLDYRSRATQQQAVAFLRSGQLGKVVHARAWDYKRRDGIGKVVGPQRIPEHVDYDLWCGPAPVRPLMRTKLHYDWHWQWATGNGEIGNNGSHQLDRLRWAIGKENLPATVLTFGGRYGYVDDGETPNTLAAVYDYDGIPVIYEARNLPDKSGSKQMDDLLAETAGGKPVRLRRSEGAGLNDGYAVFCEGGYLHNMIAFDNDGKEIRRFTGDERMRPQEKFIAAVRSRKTADLATDILEGHRSASICHMGNLSIQCGGAQTFAQAANDLHDNAPAAAALERMSRHLSSNGIDPAQTPLTVGAMLAMDSETERFTGKNSERANLFLKDSYRAPFTVPEAV
jgi:predicted dehydrogenase